MLIKIYTVGSSTEIHEFKIGTNKKKLANKNKIIMNKKKLCDFQSLKKTAE